MESKIENPWQQHQERLIDAERNQNRRTGKMVINKEDKKNRNKG